MKQTSIALFLMMVAGCGSSAETEEGRAQPLLPPQEGVPETSVREGSAAGGTYFNGVLYVSYVGTDSRINIVRRVNGTWFKRTLDEWVAADNSRSIALCVYRNHLYAAWLGTDSQRTLNIRRSSDGDSWPDDEKWEVSAEEGPHAYPLTLVTYGDRLNAFTISSSNTTLKQYIFTPAGLEQSASWWQTNAIELTAAVLGNELVVGWKFRDNQTLKVRKFIPGLGWSVTHDTGITDIGSLIAADTSPPSLIYGGFNHPENSDGIGDWQIFFSRSTDGLNFQFVSNVPDTSAHPVQMLRANAGEIEFAWVGMNRTRNVNVGGIPR